MVTTTHDTGRQRRGAVIDSRGSSVKYIIAIVIASVVWAAIVLVAILVVRPSSGLVIAEELYVNYAWGFTYSGTAVTDKGVVFDFRIPESKQDELMQVIDADDIKLKSDFLWENRTAISARTINESTIDSIARYIKQVDRSQLEDTCDGRRGPIISTSDAGTNSLSVYDYDDNEIIKLRSTGDLVSTNCSNAGRKLIDILQNDVFDQVWQVMPSA